MDELKSYALGCIGIVVVIMLVMLVFSIQIVQPGHAAIVTRFGKLDQSARRDGVYIEPLASVNVLVTVIYQLRSDKLFDIFQTIGNESDIQSKLIVPNTSAAVKASTVEYTADNILTDRIQLTEKIKTKLAVILDKNNIDLVNVAVRDISFVDEGFNKSIEEKQIAEQNSEKAKFELETSKITAQKQAALQQSLTPEILQKMWLDKWNGVLPTTLTGTGTNFYLPVQ